MYYKYSVLTETGHEISGVEEGFIADIKKKFQQNNYYILSLEPDFSKTIKSVFEKKRLNSNTLAVFFEDISNMLKTGISINEAFIVLEESSAELVLTKALFEINDSITKGFSLTSAFAKTNAFPWLVLNMLEVGEKSGEFCQIFQDLAKFYARDADFKLNLQNALVYPIAVFALLISLMFYVSFKVVPHLQSLILGNSNLPASTRMILFMSSSLHRFWWLILVITGFLVFILTKIPKSKIDRLAVLYYKLPLFGGIIKDISFSVVFLNLSVLQKNGVSIVDSLDLIAKTVPYKFMSKKLLVIKDYISGGLSLWQTIEKDSFFPPFVYYAVKKGEEMGKLDEYLNGLSVYFLNKANRRIQVVMTFIQPVLLAFCAIFLLIICLSFMVPIYGNLSNMAGGVVNN